MCTNDFVIVELPEAHIAQFERVTIYLRCIAIGRYSRKSRTYVGRLAGWQNEVPGPAQQHFFGQHKESRNYRVFRRSGVCEYEEVNKAELSAYVE